DIVEVGTGGGSIAWMDNGGALHVGPHSAGAEPGPACYGRGGTAPTITHANALPGRLPPAPFLGGGVPLHPPAASEASAGARRCSSGCSSGTRRLRHARSRRRGYGQYSASCDP